MIKEAYCSYEIAKLLKEKGFNELCFRLIREDGEYIERPSQAWNGMTKKQRAEWYIQPTLQMACAWLRGKHIIIDILAESSKTKSPTYMFNIWDYEYPQWNKHIESYQPDFRWSEYKFPTYEAATEAALKYVLENLL